MPSYIDRDLAIEMITNDAPDLVYYNKEEAIDCLKCVPIADVEEVRRGKWIYKGHHEIMGHAFQCSACERWMFTNSPNHVVEEYPYCHCGAKMEDTQGFGESYD